MARFSRPAPHREPLVVPLWSGDTGTLLRTLGTSDRGLSSADARERLARTGRNVPVAHRRLGTLRLIVAQFTSPITILLLVAAALSIAVGERTDGSIILGALLASAALGFWQEHRASTAVEQLLALVRSTTMVVRDGREMTIALDEVVPGDIAKLVAGSSVPGDARLLAAKDLFVDEAALTGESFPSEKDVCDLPADTPLARRRNAIFLGTHVVSGTATAVVVHTGPATAFGDVARRLELRPPRTEFEIGVRHFGYLLLEVTLVLVIGIFAINVALHRPVLDALLFTLALAVGLTPQLLPAIVLVTLSVGARHMATERVIVRRLSSIEDLGGMEILCTDKTGTITEGNVVAHAYEDWRGGASERVRLFAHLNARFESGFPNPIDAALRAATVAGADAYSKVDEVPYDFVRKRLSIVVADGTGARTLITKGAVSAVLDVCSTAEDVRGSRVTIADARPAVTERLATESRAGYRCIGVAYRTLGPDEAPRREAERDLTLLGIVTFEDPIKADARDALADLASLGIRPIIVTGDNRYVAEHLAREAGLPQPVIMTGAELDRLSDMALLSAAPRVSVFAETEPRQKERVIRSLKRAGYAVGYLGDGINDAPALYAADVGISVHSAADVTRQAADVVLLEKDLLDLGRGVREGRRAFANTLKYVFITASANFGNMFSMAGASLVAPFLPMLPKQILVTNVLTDLPAMSIAGDRLDEELVARPRRWHTREIGRFMLVFGLVSSVFDYLTFGTLLLLRVQPAVFRTAWFIESILSELLILLVIRTRRPLVRSRVGRSLLWSSVGVAVVTLALPWSGFGAALGLAPITWPIGAAVAVILLLYVSCSEMIKSRYYAGGGGSGAGGGTRESPARG